MHAEAELRDWNLGSLQDAVLLLAGVKRNLRVHHFCTVYASTQVFKIPSLHSEGSSGIDSQGGEVPMPVERGWAWRVCF